MTWNGTATGSDIIVTVLQGTNENSGGLFGLFLLILVIGIVYFRNRNEPTREAITGALWVGVLVGVLLRLLGVLSDMYLGFVIVLAIGALVMLINRD